MDPNRTISETEHAKAVEYDEKKKKAFALAMKGKWEDVIEMYKSDSTLHKARITRAGDTALHIAVSDGKEDVVKKMVDSTATMSREERKRSLQTHNQRMNTALHLAASMGNATMCQIIASAEPSLVNDRNVDGETPLFLAALHGRKQVFLRLHYIRNPITNEYPNYENCRRKNGDTILHCAIAGEHFDLAFQIIHLYEELANSVNEEGLSPLHLLASKPHSFKSGSRLGRIETIIYHCIYVEKMKKIEGSLEQSYPIANDLEARGSQEKRETNPLFPANYRTCLSLIKFFYVAFLIILGHGSEELKKIYRKKEKHTWSVQIVKKLLCSASTYEYDQNDGSNPHAGKDDNTMMTQGDGAEGADAAVASVKPSSREKKECEKHPKRRTLETPILVAAKNGVKEKIEEIVGSFRAALHDLSEDKKNVVLLTVPVKEVDECKRRTIETTILVAAKNGVMEIIEEIVGLFPVALYDLNEDKKNVLLLAVEHRQPHVYEFLRKKNIFKESVFRQLDKEGNSALHLAAKLGTYKPWLIPGEALQMQWELKWFKFVNEEMPPDFFVLYNKKNQTPEDIFTETHKELVQSAADWLHKTSESCSVVAALIATVAFATAATVPGGVDQDSGHPTLETEPAFEVFAISSLVALGFSVTAVVMFLSIMTSRFQEHNFNKDLPRKLIAGFTSLFMSIAAMLVSFCAGHFFVLKDQLHYAALPIYLAACLPVTLFVMAQFPLYFDLIWATFKHVPQRSYKPT